MTWNVGVRAGFLRSALSSAGSYQAPKYHIKTMLRARYFASTSYGVLLLSPSSNRNASMIAWSRLDALRFILTSRSRYSSPDGNLSLAVVTAIGRHVSPARPYTAPQRNWGRTNPPKCDADHCARNGLGLRL